ncbi:unnamed protein product [Clonostachys rosea]|uniref:Radical SAM core domain-containing protein n=1 Tax=Bionectria ochroleuca TaxID=29856 RepID=A0ABY6V2D2_BIOOC|nr:unnamed protein product [Clonostachys rosea]
MTTNGTLRLSEDGLARAECLREVFGPASEFKIGLIVVQQFAPFKPSIIEKLGYDTIAPLAKDLDINIRSSCPRKVPGCVLDTIDYWTGKGNALVCWEAKLIGDLSRMLGVRHLEEYPPGRFDIIWGLTSDRYYIRERTLMKCPGLDVPWLNLDSEEEEYSKGLQVNQGANRSVVSGMIDP